MRVSFKLLLWMWLALFGVLGLMFYGAYNKLEPKAFIALLNAEASRNYPGSTLEVGKIDYRFSIDFNLSLKEIKLIRNNEVLTSINQVELKVPWWLILFNRGNAQINISDLTIFIEKDKESSGIITESSSSTKSSTVKFELPSYLVDANYTLRAKNIKVQELNSSRRFFTLSKILVKEFQYGKNSAFELKLPIEINHKNTQYSSELWIFGDVTPNVTQWDLQFRGEFKTREVSDKFQLDDLIIDGKASFKPQEFDVISNINLLIDKNQIGSGRINARQDSMKLHFEFIKLPLTYLSLVGDEIKNQFRTKSEGFAQGVIEFSKDLKRASNTTLSGSLSFDGLFSLSQDVTFPGKWKMIFENSKWETSFISPKGEVSFFHRAFLDFKKGLVTQYSQELGFEGLDYSLVSLPVMNLETFRTLPDQTYFTSQISFKKSLDGEKLVDGNFRYGISPDKKFYRVELHDADSNFKLDFQNKSDVHQIHLEAKTFKWHGFLKFLDPYFNQEEGTIDGKIQGNWETPWESGKWLVNLNFTDSKNMSGEISQIKSSLLNVFDMKLVDFHNFKWNASVTPNVVKIKSLSLEGNDPAIIFGTINYLPTQKSNLSLSYPKNKKWKPIKKEMKEGFWKKEQL